MLLYIHLGLSLLQAVSEAADDSNHISLHLAIFPLGKPSSLNGSDFLFFIKMNFYQQISNGYLERFHHELRIHKENSTDTEFPLLQLLHQLFHHWQVCVEFNLTWITLRMLTGRNVKQTGTVHSYMYTGELHLNKNWQGKHPLLWQLCV